MVLAAIIFKIIKIINYKKASYLSGVFFIAFFRYDCYNRAINK